MEDFLQKSQVLSGFYFRFFPNIMDKITVKKIINRAQNIVPGWVAPNYAMPVSPVIWK